MTGVSFLISLLAAKQFEVLHETVPNAAAIGLLVNPKNPNTDSDARDVQIAAASLGHKLVVVEAAAQTDFERAFDTLVEHRVSALCVDADRLFTSWRDQLVMLSARRALPTVYSLREFPAAGGLMSYGTSLTDAYRLMGIYTARILHGAKPADLPVQQSTKFELVLNLKTARALGLTFPLPLVGRADEVIE